MSPAVRRLAREHDVVLTTVRGTGTNGRVTANDVIAAAHQGPAAVMAATILREPEHPSPPAAAPVSVATTQVPGTSTYGAPTPGTIVPLTQARKLIAKRMTESLATAPHAWTMVEVDVTKLWRWRAQEKDRFLAEKGYGLTLLPFFVHAVVQALKKQPLLNARYTDDGIYVHREINIGIAIGLDTNLIVPVIREADALSIGGIAVAAGKLIEKARAGKLGADELGGGTFTVNNTGANGSILSKPIINGGQAGIVTMEAVVKRPVVVDDAIAIRQIMNVCLSLDHRVIDGTIANAFLAELKGRLEAMRPGGDL
jgi:2-oxoisovalerate dehydrogenase E2 component (dihydrolipoyl transacylase)